MDNPFRFRIALGAFALTIAMVFASVLLVVPARSQDSQVQEKVAAIKTAMAVNKQALAQYTWQEQETISIKGDVKDTKLYQVQIGANGQQQKTELSDQPAQSGGDTCGCGHASCHHHGS